MDLANIGVGVVAAFGLMASLAAGKTLSIRAGRIADRYDDQLAYWFTIALLAASAAASVAWAVYPWFSK